MCIILINFNHICMLLPLDRWFEWFLHCVYHAPTNFGVCGSQPSTLGCDNVVLPACNLMLALLKKLKKLKLLQYLANNNNHDIHYLCAKLKLNLINCN